MVLVDGQERAVIPVDDLGFTTGYAVFETLRTYDRQPFRVDEHLSRLRRSAEWCRIAMPSELAREIARVADAEPGESKINVFLTGSGCRVVRSGPLDLARVGLPVRLTSRLWTPDPALPAWVKHTNRLATTLASEGVDEALHVAPDGVWTETSRANLFVVRGGKFLTPPDDGRILRGVTRDVVLHAARKGGVGVVEAPLPVGPVDEMWVCSTLKGLAPVLELDGVALPTPRPVGERIAGYLPGIRGRTSASM